MQIKALSQQTKLPAKTIRYYEEISLLLPPRRLANGYRDYEETAVSRVKFVAGARTLGLSLNDISELLALRDRKCARCGTRLRPLPDDCCVFCSYGDHPCIAKQREEMAEDQE